MTDRPSRQQMIAEPKTLGRYAVGDMFFHGEGGASLSGRVEKVGRKWVTVSWEDFGGAGWQKQHLPEWLDGMGLNKGDAAYSPWEPNRPARPGRTDAAC